MVEEQEFWQNFNELVDRTLVPRYSPEAIQPCAKDDFQDFRKTLTDHLGEIVSLLDVVIQNKHQWTSNAKKNLIKVIVIIGEQSCKSVWNTKESIEISKLIVPKICEIFCCENLMQILNDETFVSILMFLRPKLMKNTWKSFPGAAVCYKWLLISVEKPMLKRHVSEVLPTALIICDDYVKENQAVGLECISLIIEHCEKSRSLRNMNYDEVIYQSLERMAHKVDPSMIIPLYNCIASLLENIQFGESKMNSFGWTKQDCILMILFDNMELQSNPDCRYAYTMSLMKLLRHSSTGKWSERLGRILSEYCENNNDSKTTLASLELLKKFLLIYQPQGSNFYIAMFSSLLKLLCKIKTSGRDRKVMREKAIECISLLSEFSPKHSAELMSSERVKSILNEAQA